MRAVPVSGKPDVILLDILMPKMDDPETRLSAYDAGGDDILAKPISAQVLRHNTGTWRRKVAMETSRGRLRKHKTRHTKRLSAQSRLRNRLAGSFRSPGRRRKRQ